ncbi:substrate-binding domain-containing protein [Streptomyces sp. NA02950]|uniref:substrate-binding domain-containing protein n=1 Tax=Streptomyces sp. NA02950 TaxID=2742137 RepID=UPI0015918A6A|nr:substrate-binding domain-containing protein [Streptomyces sp. NA02950]QKV91841.1 substrate-binding domain-containing protein [Streptomyces sp. NA02950]
MNTSPARARLRIAVAATAATALAVTLAACGKAAQVEQSGDAAHHRNLRIGLLLPDNEIARFDRFDKPLIIKRIKELCPRCTVDYASAQHDAATQQHQVDSMIANGVEVLILDAVDGRAIRSSVVKARQANIPVVAYDRLAEGPVSGYVSFNGAEVGRLQGEALLAALGPHTPGDLDQIVMMNGSSTDPNSDWFERGSLDVLRGKVKIGKSYETIGWRPENANLNMSGAIAALGADNIQGVLAANDGLASGVISALKAAKIRPLPPVTGQDAELGAVQRIVAGEQLMTVYKPFEPEAYAAAEMAVALGRGKSLAGIAGDRVNSGTSRSIPAVLLHPITVNVHNIKILIRDGMYTNDQICTEKYADACRKAGLIT